MKDLVPEPYHGGQRTKRTGYCNQEECFFRDSPSHYLCLELVTGKNKKSQNIQAQVNDDNNRKG